MERNAEEKYEYDNGDLTPMSRASLIHNQIVTNLLVLLGYNFKSIVERQLTVFSWPTKKSESFFGGP